MVRDLSLATRLRGMVRDLPYAFLLALTSLAPFCFLHKQATQFFDRPQTYSYAVGGGQSDREASMVSMRNMAHPQHLLDAASALANPPEVHLLQPGPS